MKKIWYLILLASPLHAQELVKTDYEQGYVKDGKKYSVWQYFDDNKKPELVINHTTGRVTFVSKDTSDYVIFKDGQWVSSKLDVHPIPIEGIHHFYQSIFDTLKYPAKDFKNGLEGKVVIMFEVDTLGATTNCNIVKSIGGSCDSAVLAAFKAIDQKWIAAKIGKKKYSTRLGMQCHFRLDRHKPPLEYKDSINATLLEDFIIKDPFYGNRLYQNVTVSAEFPGGNEEMAEYLTKNYEYPSNAVRSGIRGIINVRFDVEVDGSVINVEIVEKLNAEFTKEQRQNALKMYDNLMMVFKKMPKWIPAELNDKKVKQSLIEAFAF